MTDYSNLKLTASSSPHTRSAEDTRSIMMDVIIALLPALAWGIYSFGAIALAKALSSVVACVFFEWAYRKLLKKPQHIEDCSAAVTGLLLALVCPWSIPIWVLIIGDFFAIIVVKQLYGGIGCNFLNPALAGRAVLLASYSGVMTKWSIKQGADAISTATPLAMMKDNTAEAFSTLKNTYTILDMFLGRDLGGCVGEISALMILVGGLYLIIRRVISWQIPIAFIGTVALLTLIFHPEGVNAWLNMAYNVFAGGLFLGAFFMATDYATSPVTKVGQLLFGVGCGLITVFIRRFGSYPEGVCYSILIMNCTTWLLDKYIQPTVYGAIKRVKEGASK